MKSGLGQKGLIVDEPTSFQAVTASTLVSVEERTGSFHGFGLLSGDLLRGQGWGWKVEI